LLLKEREAVQTIMDQKIKVCRLLSHCHLNLIQSFYRKVLVESVANALGAVLQNSPQAGGMAGQALAKVQLITFRRMHISCGFDLTFTI
jgi:ketopantoate reductase